ncbi:MAG TPA: protease modulator HflK N-terminal domain-containing protein, partial [Ottowia sp.]|nr:protease modulator HflK N-terminal domain-containing protein [Ottowia sp.]
MTMFSSAARLPERVRGMFNLNDPRWGRDDTPQDNGGSPEGGEPPQRPPQDQPPRGRGPNQGPPDLDELWRDFNRRLTGMFGGRGGGGNGGRRGGGGDFQPDMKSAGL